jgi:hypothetical protein
MNPENVTKKFLHKRCRLIFKTYFSIYGVVDGVDEHGVVFTTDQKSSFISWDEILRLTIEGDSQ